MAFETLSENLENSSEKVQELIKHNTEYYKLRIFKTVTKGAISLVNIFVIGVFVLLALLFLSFGVALWLNDILESRYSGYFIIAGFYFIMMLIVVFVGRKYIEQGVLIKLSDIFFENEEAV